MVSEDDYMVSWDSINDHIQLEEAIQKSYPSNNGLMWNEILFLSQVQNYTTDQSEFPDFWCDSYAISDPKKLIKKLINMNFIRVVDVYSSLNDKKATELKEILRDLGLKISGKKIELIDRIVENTSCEYLENLIFDRKFELTELGKEELSQNDYVLRFNYRDCWYGVDIWWMNRQIHIYPNLNYKDIVFIKLKKQFDEAKSEIRDGMYFKFIRICEVMSRFLATEENDYEAALFYIISGVFYRANKDSVDSFVSKCNSYNWLLENGIKPSYSFPHYDECLWIDVSLITKIKNALNLTHDELSNKIVSILEDYNLNDQIFSNHKLSEYVLCSVLGEFEKIKTISDDIENTLILKNNIKKPVDLRNASYSDNQVVLINQKGKQLENEGLIDEAISTYEINVANGFKGSFPYERLAEIYHNRKDYENEIRVIEAFFSTFNEDQLKQEIEETPKLKRLNNKLQVAKELINKM